MAGVNAPPRRKNAVEVPAQNFPSPSFIRPRTGSKSRSLVSWTMNDLKLHQLPAGEVAEELTLMDAERLRKIRPDELKDGAWMNKEKKQMLSPNVLVMVKLSNQLAVLVPREILEGTTSSARAKIVSAFIKIASKCHRLRNYNSLKAVLAGLQCTPIYRLTKTWKVVPSKRKKKFDKLSALMSEEHNWKAYRTELQHLIVSNTPCVPFLGVLLTTIVQQESFHFTHAKQQLARKQSVLEGYTILEAITVRNRLEKLRRLNHSKYSTVTLPTLKAALSNGHTVHPISEHRRGTVAVAYQNSESCNAEDHSNDEAATLNSMGCIVEDADENRKPGFLKLFEQQSFGSKITEELSQQETAWRAKKTRLRFRKKLHDDTVDDRTAFSILQEAQAVEERIEFGSSNYWTSANSDKTRSKRQIEMVTPKEMLVRQQKISLGQIDLDIFSSSDSDSLSANSSSSSLDISPSASKTELGTSGRQLQHPLSVSSVSNGFTSRKRHSSNEANLLESSDAGMHHASDTVDTDLCHTIDIEMSHASATVDNTEMPHALDTVDTGIPHASDTVDTDLCHTVDTEMPHASDTVDTDLCHTVDTEMPHHYNAELHRTSNRTSTKKNGLELCRKRSNAITEYDIERTKPHSPTRQWLSSQKHPLTVTMSRSLEGLKDACLEQDEFESPLTKTTSLQSIDNNLSSDETNSNSSQSQSNLLQCLQAQPTCALNGDSSSSSLLSSGSDTIPERRPSVTYIRKRRRASLVIKIAQIEQPKNPIDLLYKYQFLSLGCCTRSEGCKAELRTLISLCPVNAEAQNYKFSYEREP